MTQLAPDLQISFPGTARPPLRLVDLRGKPLILMFRPRGAWDPSAEELHHRYEEALPKGMPLIEGSAEVPAEYHVEGRSAAFLIDAEGRIVWSRVAAPGETLHPNDLARAFANDSFLVTRREFLGAAAMTAVVISMPPIARAAVLGTTHGKSVGPGAIDVSLKINGTPRTMKVEPRVTLLDALREHAGLTGTKKSCDRGQCGACTVMVDGRRVNSCLTLAVSVEGRDITTIEGLSNTPALHPMQAAFLEHDGFQCGFCTPGQIMSAVAMQTEGWGSDDASIREAMSGNICRCGAYENILAAIKNARKA